MSPPDRSPQRRAADLAPAIEHAPVVRILPTPPPRIREVSAVSLTPGEQSRLTRHNQSIGTSLQRAAMKLTFLVLLAPLGAVVMRILFRVRTENAERLRVLENSSGIFAIRHFYEVDPFVPFYAAAWIRALRRRHMVAFSLASRSWTRNRVLRAASWCLGVMGLSRGLGLKQSATERAVEILQGKELACAAIYPTGPIGKRKDFTLGPGVGYMAVHCPELPVVPVTMTGVQEFRWRDVLLFRRPLLRVAIGRPIYGREAAGHGIEQRAENVCDMIAERWADEEQRLGGDTMEEPRA